MMSRDAIVPTTQQQYTWAVREFLLFLAQRQVRAMDVDRETLSAFLEERLKAYRRECRHRPPKMGEWRRRYLSGIRRYLRQVQGKWPPPLRPEPEIDEYRIHLRNRGLAESTILDYCLHVRIFLAFIRAKALSVEAVEPKDVEAYSRVMVRMYREHRPKGSKGAASCRAVGLRCVRNFLRFRRGIWPPDPSPAVLARFEQHLHALRHRPRVIVYYVRAAKRFFRFLVKHGLALETAQPADVDRFLQTEIDQYSRGPRRTPASEKKWRSKFRAPISSLLQLIRPPWPPPKVPDNAPERIERDIYHGYCCWLKGVCGQAEASLWKKGIEVRMLFQWLRHHAIMVPSLSALEQKHIDDYLAWRLPPLRRATRTNVCSALRSFLRYLHESKLINRDLATGVSGASKYQFEEIPRSFTPEQIDAIIGAARRDGRTAGLRDYAMLLMMRS
jgi:site-specific recombinase XerD